MLPNSSAGRQGWILSLPAIAVLISFLWFRKKRGALETDSGGIAEEVNTLTTITSNNETVRVESSFEIVLHEDCVEAVESSSSAFGGESSCQAGNFEAILTEEFIDNQKVEEEKVEENEEEAEEAVESTNKVVNVEEKEPETETVEGKPVVVVNFSETEQKVEVATVVQKESPKVNADITGVKKKELMETPQTPKWIKKKRGKKNNKKIAKEKISLMDGATQNLAKLDLTGKGEKTNTERDSANNSPSEVMLRSPTCSACSDTRSEGSSDSGKGCSEVRTPSPTPVSGNSVSGDLPQTIVYEFCIPQHLVGRLIGRNGSYIHEIKENTHAAVFIKRHPDTQKLKICAIEGTQMDVDSALDMIRQKFPKKRYPHVTLEQVHIIPEPMPAPVLSENMYIYLVEGITNDVTLSSLVSAGHFFLQQPFHPTYPSLGRLFACMKHCYSQPNQPLLPDDVQAGVLCAAPVEDGWYRAELIGISSDGQFCDVKFVDYGGYMTLPKSNLRQIRADFTYLPFQAAECYLAAVAPNSDDGCWSEEAKKLVEDYTFGKVIHAQIYGYAENGVPLIYLYAVHDNQVVFVNEELVNKGFGYWLVPAEDEFYTNANCCSQQQPLMQTQEQAAA